MANAVSYELYLNFRQLHSSSLLERHKIGPRLPKKSRVQYRTHSFSSNMPLRGLHAMCAARKNEEPALLKLAVGTATELLRIFSREEPSAFGSGSFTSEEVSIANIDDIIVILQSDYKRSYFLTGEFTTSIYSEDCCFADPTIKFSGRELYQRNLRLLAPFFEKPSLCLFNIKEGLKGGTRFIKAKWQLRTYLKLPWRPLISLEGSTLYDLDDNLKIISHVESWNISAFEAFAQIFIPSSRVFPKK